jgi:hypothetical protein
MISKADLKAAVRSSPPGEPPTGEEIEAYLAGELSAEEAEKLQERLAAHPDIARLVAAPFPAADDPEVVGYMRYRSREPRVLLFWRTTAIAASVMVAVFGGLLVQTQTKTRRLARELTRPHSDLENALLLPDGQRGKPSDERPITLPAAGEDILVMPALINEPQFPTYRIDIVDLNQPTPRTIWSRSGLRRRTDDTFEILLPRAFLAPGIYEIVVFGVDGTNEQLAKYTVKVPRRAEENPY